MKTVYERPKSRTDAITTYCGGCGHGIVNRIIGELIDEMGLRDNSTIIWPIGCSVYADKFFDVDQICALHGRAPAVATGVKRALPDKFVLAYQGDGDMVSEGMAEIMHAAIRAEKFTVIFINNAIYGMTGAQMAPTTLEGQISTTSPKGRTVNESGYPVNMAEIMAAMPGVVYSERVTVNTPARVDACKKAIKKAFELQIAGEGLTFVEVLSPCPTGWSTTPVKAMEWIDGSMTSIYPLGVFKSPEGGVA